MRQLLLDEYPLIVLPQLAVEIGLNEAIVLQQIHYWLQRTENVRDGEKWIYNTQDAWQAQFPFWSLATVKRTLSSLKDKGLVITANYNDNAFNRTTWYRIDYSVLSELSSSAKCANGAAQDATMDQRVSGPSSYTETTTEITQRDDPESHYVENERTAADEALTPLSTLDRAGWLSARAWLGEQRGRIPRELGGCQVLGWDGSTLVVRSSSTFLPRYGAGKLDATAADLRRRFLPELRELRVLGPDTERPGG